MSFANLQFAINRVKTRRAAVYAFSKDGATVTKHHLGEVKDAMMRITPLVTPKSTRGAETQVGFACEITFDMQQTSDEEFAALPMLLRENALGTTFKFTEKARDSGDAPGYVFENATATIDAEIRFDGEPDSYIRFTLKGEFGNEALAALGTPLAADDADRGLVTGDRVLQF